MNSYIDYMNGISVDAELHEKIMKRATKTPAHQHRNRAVFRYAGLAACAAVVSLCVWAMPALLNSRSDNIESGESDIHLISPEPTEENNLFATVIDGDPNDPASDAYPQNPLCAPVVPKLRNESLTIAEARNDPDFGAYLPQGFPSKFRFGVAQRILNQTIDALVVFWYADEYDQLVWNIFKPTEYDLARVVSVNEREKYDLSLYPIPRYESVPREYREYVNNPVFRAEELSFDVIQSRAYYVDNDIGDTPGWRMEFSVLYGDVVVSVRLKGVSPEHAWEMFAGLGR